MYQQKKLVDDTQEMLYFRYAPPLLERHVDYAVYPGKRPDAPYEGAVGWHCSIYYFWWAFLKENKDFREGRYADTDTLEGRVWRSFRGVGEMNFPNWWVEVGRFLFAEPRAGGIRIEKPPVDPQLIDDRVLVSVPFNGDVERTLSEMRAVLSKAFVEQGLSCGTSKARYPVRLNTSLTSLYRRYCVWRIRRDNPNLSLVEVGRKANLEPNGPIGDVDVRQAYVSSISRDLRHADHIISQVGRGLFPIMTPQQLENIEAGVSLTAYSNDEGSLEVAEPGDMARWIDEIHKDDPERAKLYKADLLARMRQGL